MAALCIGIGAIAGALFWHLRSLRNRGRFFYLLSWVMAVSLAAGMIAIVECIKTGQYLDLVFAVSLGALVGLGFGLLAEDPGKNRSLDAVGHASRKAVNGHAGAGRGEPFGAPHPDEGS